MIPRTRDALSALLSRTFPEGNDIDPQTVDAFVDALMEMKGRTTAADLDGGHAPQSVRSPGEFIVYHQRATHARRTPVTSVFTGEAQSVRTPLPADEPRKYETPIGVVLPSDHLLPTVSAVREKYGSRIRKPFSRIDLVSPARHSTVRFSPMSLYLGYETEESTTPFFVVFEAGSALGKPMALYLAETIDTVIEEPAGYAPTPFSSPDHWYSGGLRMAANGRDPEALYMRASKDKGGEPYLRLHVEYLRADGAPVMWPAREMVEAALRAMAIMKGMGLDQNVVERMVAAAGLVTVPWVDKPTNASPEAAGVSRPSAPPLVSSTAFDPFIADLPADERRTFESSVVLLLAEIVRADGKFDRLERIEVDWTMNFQVPAVLGDAFRFSEAAEAEYRSLMHGAPRADQRPFEVRLTELGGIVAKLPEPLRAHYRRVVADVCAAAAESSGGWLWFGTKVSKEEKAVLTRIEEALGLEARPEAAAQSTK
jgi:hypothetical protein